MNWLTSDAPLRSTLVALVSAIACAWAIDRGLYAIAAHGTPSGYFTDYSSDETLPAVVGALSSKEVISLWASSELGMGYDPAITYRFLPEARGQKVVAVGGAGMQTLAILGQLGAHSQLLAGAQILVMLGPVWFNGRTSVELFLRYMPVPVMASFYFNGDLTDEVRHVVEAFVEEHYREIQAPTLVMQLIHARAAEQTSALSIAWLTGRAFFTEYVPALVEERHLVYRQAHRAVKAWLVNHEHSSAPSGQSASSDWAGLYRESIDQQEKHSKSNSYGVDDTYYNRYYVGRLPTRTASPTVWDQEFGDFETLVHLLRAHGAKVLWVVESYNALSYSNLADYTPVMDKVRAILRVNDQPFLDLWDAVYQIGEYKDVMHLGTYGWYRVDRAALEYFAR